MVSSSSSTARTIASPSRSIADSTATSASSEYGGRRSREASRGPCGVIEYSAGELDIFPGRALPVGVSQKRRGVVGHDQRHPVETVDLPTQLADRQRGLQQSLCRKRAEGKDDAGSQDSELLQQVGTAHRDFVWLGVPIARGAVLQNIADEDVLALEINRREDPRQQLPGGSYERPSRLIFRGARRFAHTDELRLWAALARYRVPCGGVQAAKPTRRDRRRDGVERGMLCRVGCLR